MKIDNQKITIDLSTKIAQVAWANKGDVNARTIDFYIMQKGTPVDLTGIDIEIYCTTPAETTIGDPLHITNAKLGKAQYRLPTDITSVDGVTKAVLVFRQDTTQLVSFEFDIRINRTIYDENAITSENRFGVLVTALHTVKEYDEALKDAAFDLEKKYTNRLNGFDAQLDNKANKSEVGSPLVAANVSGMTDKTKVYVNTTDGKWYSWNGTAWVVGGTYNSQGIGDKSISPIKTDFIDVVESKNKLNSTKLTQGFMQNSGIVATAEWALTYSYTPNIACDKSKKVFFTKSGAPSAQIGAVFLKGVFVSAISSIATITAPQDTAKTFYYKIVFNSDAPTFDTIVLNILNESITNKEKLYVMYDLDDSQSGFSIANNYIDFSIKNVINNSVEIPISQKANTLDETYRQKIINDANPELTKNVVNCWGDSLTRGVGCTNYATKSYPSILKNLLSLDVTVNNLGVGGEGVQQIAARQGGAFAYIQPCTIPASGSVTIALKDSSGNSVNLVQQTGTTETGNGGINPCYINGIKGTLTNVSGAITFTRETSGTATQLTHQTPLITNAMTNYRNGILIVWAGTNNRPYINNTPTTEKNEIFNVIKRIKNIISYSSTKDYIVVGMTSKSYMSQVVDVNKLLSNEFGSNFLDLRSNILTDGLQLAGITPTAQDTTDIANGEIPSSLRVDDVHFNDKGYSLIGNYVYEHGKSLGYW